MVVDDDDDKAHAKFQDYLSYASQEAALALFSAWTGVDWSGWALDEPLKYIETNASRSALAGLTRIDAERQWTVGDISRYIAIGGIHPTLVGSPQNVADALEAFADASGVDGFNLAYAISPGSFEDFVRWVVPELQARGRMRRVDGSSLTLRERLQGEGQITLRNDHPGTQFRHLDTHYVEEAK